MHSQTFTALNTPAISVGLAPIALRQIMDQGGSCYQSLRVVQALIDEGGLFIVKDAPVYPRPVYMVYPDDANETSRLQLALEGFRHVAR